MDEAMGQMNSDIERLTNQTTALERELAETKASLVTAQRGKMAAEASLASMQEVVVVASAKTAALTDQVHETGVDALVHELDHSRAQNDAKAAALTVESENNARLEVEARTLRTIIEDNQRTLQDQHRKIHELEQIVRTTEELLTNELEEDSKEIGRLTAEIDRKKADLATNQSAIARLENRLELMQEQALKAVNEKELELHGKPYASLI